MEARLCDWPSDCGPSAGHPDGVWLYRGVLGPRPGGPPHRALHRRALRRRRVPGQAVRLLRLRGKDAGGNHCGGREVTTQQNRCPHRDDWGITTKQLGKKGLSEDGVVQSTWWVTKQINWKMTVIFLFFLPEKSSGSNQEQTREIKLCISFNQVLFALYE